jgi:hypothetical protein
MKTILAAILFVSSVSLTAFGGGYSGTITQTVTATNDPAYSVGETLTGNYEYDSPTVNGVFYADPFDGLGEPASEDQTLNGSVYLTFPNTFNGFNALDSTRDDGMMTVTGGAVTGFDWGWESGNYYAIFGGGEFSTTNYDLVDPTTGEFLPDIDTSGTLTFSTPVSSVPESSPTIWPLTAVLCGCLFRHAWAKNYRRSILMRV